MTDQRPGLPRVFGIDLDYYVKGGGLLLVDYAATTGFGFLVVFCFTNYSTKELYGSYTYMQSILFILMLFSLPGMGTAVMRSSSLGYDGALLKGISLRLRFSLLGSLALWGCAAVFHYLGKPQFAVASLWCSAFFPMLFSFTDFRHYLQGRQWFGTYVIYGVISTSISSCATIAAILWDGSFLIILLSNLGSRILADVFFVLLLVPKFRNRKVDDDFIPFARNLSGLAVLGTIVLQVDKLLIGSYLGMIELALYKLAWTLTEPIRALGVFLNRLTFPRFVKYSGRAAFVRYRKKLPIAILMIFPIWLAAALLLPLVVRHLFPDYTDSIRLLQWMIASNVITILLIHLETFYVSQERLQRIFYLANIVRMTLMLLLMLLLIGPFGSLGVIWSRLVVRVGGLAFYLYRIYRNLDLPQNISEED